LADVASAIEASPIRDVRNERQLNEVRLTDMLSNPTSVGRLVTDIFFRADAVTSGTGRANVPVANYVTVGGGSTSTGACCGVHARVTGATATTVISDVVFSFGTQEGVNVAAVTTVPIPGALWLFASGLLGLGAAIKRRGMARR
jgi:hypothetical protein